MLGFNSISERPISSVETPSGGSSFVVTPGIATLVLTAQTPSMVATNNIAVTPGIISLSLTAQTPIATISDNKVAVPGTASLSITAQTPTVALSDNKIVTPGVASLSISLQTPSIVYDQTIIPGLINLSTTNQTPDVVVSNNVFITPGVESMLSAMFAPSVVVSDNKSITFNSPTGLTLSALSPTLSEGQNVSPDIIGTVLDAKTPSVAVTYNVFVTPGIAQLFISQYGPSVVVATKFFAPYYWNGSSWVKKPVKHWNGTDWETKIMRAWNGSEWV